MQFIYWSVGCHWMGCCYVLLSVPTTFPPFPMLSLKFVHLHGESGEKTGHLLSERDHLLIWLTTLLLLWAQEREQQLLPWREEILCLQQQFRLCTASLGLVLKGLKMKMWGRTYLLQLHAGFCARLKWDVVTLIWKVCKTERNLSQVKSSDSQGLLVLGK